MEMVASPTTAKIGRRVKMAKEACAEHLDPAEAHRSRTPLLLHVVDMSDEEDMPSDHYDLWHDLVPDGRAGSSYFTCSHLPDGPGLGTASSLSKLLTSEATASREAARATGNAPLRSSSSCPAVPDLDLPALNGASSELSMAPYGPSELSVLGPVSDGADVALELPVERSGQVPIAPGSVAQETEPPDGPSSWPREGAAGTPSMSGTDEKALEAATHWATVQSEFDGYSGRGGNEASGSADKPGSARRHSQAPVEALFPAKLQDENFRVMQPFRQAPAPRSGTFVRREPFAKAPQSSRACELPETDAAEAANLLHAHAASIQQLAMVPGGQLLKSPAHQNLYARMDFACWPNRYASGKPILPTTREQGQLTPLRSGSASS